MQNTKNEFDNIRDKMPQWYIEKAELTEPVYKLENQISEIRSQYQAAMSSLLDLFGDFMHLDSKITGIQDDSKGE